MEDHVIKHMELLILAKLKFRLTAPTAAYHLHHLIAVEEEKDWSEDLARHLVEVIMEDHVLARERPSKIAHAVYHAIKEFDLTSVQILERSCPRCVFRGFSGPSGTPSQPVSISQYYSTAEPVFLSSRDNCVKYCTTIYIYYLNCPTTSY